MSVEPRPIMSGPIRSGHGEYFGFTVLETTGSATATVVLYDSASDASGPVLEAVSLSAGESTGDSYPEQGRSFSRGIFAVVTGTIAGSVFV